MSRTINTEYGELYFEDAGGEYCVYASPDFLQNVLYYYPTDNAALQEACENAHREEEPILFEDCDEFTGEDAAYAAFVDVLHNEYGVPVFER